MRKSILFAGSILCLFILVSLSYQPMVADEQIEYEGITVNICGIDRLESQRITLSNEDGEKLDEIIDELRNNLSNAETREETLIIYNDALVKLNNLGLFHNLISVDKIQQLFKNSLCLISGETSRTCFFGISQISVMGTYLSLYAIWMFLDKLITSNILDKLENLLSELYDYILAFFVYGTPIKFLGSMVTLGLTTISLRPKSYPAKGWIETVGLGGKKLWNESFYGAYFSLLVFSYAHVGIIGFKGINIYKEENEYFYMGSAKAVKLNSSPP